jgi:hypothetical protein
MQKRCIRRSLQICNVWQAKNFQDFAELQFAATFRSLA